MSFQQNVFLGSNPTTDLSEIVGENDSKAFYVDGSKLMEGSIGMNSNTLVGPNVVQFEHTTETIPPAGFLNVYAKADNVLYSRVSGAGSEQPIGGGIGGPIESTLNNVVLWGDITGDSLIDSTIVGADVVQNTLGLGPPENLVKFGTSPEQIADSSLVVADVVQSSATLPLNKLLRGAGTKTAKSSNITLTDTDVITGVASITSTSFQGDLTGDVSGGIVNITTTDNTANALNLQSSGGVLASQRILNSTGTAVDSILIDSTDGGIQLDSSSGVDVATGGFSVSSGDVDFSGAGSKNFGGGANIFSGNIDFNPVNTFDVSTINNSTNVLSLQTGGGATASQRIWNTSGTAPNSILIDSTLGGIQLDSSSGVDVATGGFSVSSGDVDLDSLDSFNVSTASNTTNAINFHCEGGADSSQRMRNLTGNSTNSILFETFLGGIQLDSGLGVDVATGGFSVSSGDVELNPLDTFNVSTTDNSVNALNLQSSGGTTTTQRILNSTGTSFGSILIESTLGGINVVSNPNEGFNISSGGFAVGPSQDASFVALNSFGVSTATNLANAINLSCSGGVLASQRMLNMTGTSANSILFDSWLGGIQFDTASGVNVASGGFSVDNIDINGNLIQATNLNGDVSLQPSGTGLIIVDGDVKITGGSPAVGKILTSDVSGVASWEEHPLPTGYLSGFEQINTSTSVATFGTTGEPSKCRDKDDSINLQWPTDTETINTATTGPGGISSDQFPVQSGTSYDVYIIGLILAPTSNDIVAIESGTDIETTILFTSNDFNVYRRIGWFRTEDAGTDIEPYIMSGKSLHRECVYTGNRGGRQILGGGSSTSFVVMSDGGFGSEDYVAPNSSTYTARTSFGNPANSTDKAEIRLEGSTLTGSEINYTISNGTPLGSGELTQGQLTIGLNQTTNQTEYRVDNAVDNLYVYIVSFRFHL